MGKFSRLGNDLYNGKRAIDFVGRSWTWYTASAIVVVIALSGVAIQGLNAGIEFTGGAQYTVNVAADQELADTLREDVADAGVPNAESPTVTTQGNAAVVVQTQALNDEESAIVIATIVETTGVDPDADLSIDEIGPSYGREVAKSSAIGLSVFLFLIVLFIWAYFREWKMSVAAIVALAHDVAITVGVYALTGFEVTPATVTGVLTILAFSLYDTVVVFDKVRENTARMKKDHQTYAQAANRAVNQTLVRSINTSIVAIIPVGVILFVSSVLLGASSLKDLSLALFVGTIAGVYSSVFIATPLLVHLKSNETDVMLAERRAKARANQADRYASVPSFTEELPVQDNPDADASDPDDFDGDVDGELEEDAPGFRPSSQTGATGRGRTVPPARGPVGESRASGRNQPSRQSKSQRKKP